MKTSRTHKSMAEKAVSSALFKLAGVDLNIDFQRYHASDYVEPMRESLLIILRFLDDAYSISHRNPIVEQWVEEVKDAAHRIEDAIATFLIEIEEYSRKGSGIISKLKRQAGHPLKLDWFRDEIKEVQLTLETINERATHMGIRETSSQEPTMDWHSEDGETSSQVLVMSYNNLPYHLKLCFLYFAFFPKDYKISAKHIAKMWIAEGFVQQDGAATLEDKAQFYLEELENRCLIEVIERTWKGRCSYFKVHDIILDLAIHKAKEDKFLTVFSKTEDETEHASQLDATVACRATLQFFNPTEYDIHLTNTRSLLLLGQYLSYYHRLKLLRVLTIERVDMRGRKLNETWLQGLVNLRYLGIRYCGQLPHEFGRVSFSSLKKLETVDFKGTKIPEGPNDSLWEVQTLRHVIASNSKIPFICDPSKWDNLINLETLKWVNLLKIPEVRFNILREIGLFLDENTDIWKEGIEKPQEKLKGVLKGMENLVSLSVISNIYVPLMDNGTSDLSCHEKIQRLHFLGKWPKGVDLNDQMLPPNLAKFTLFGSKLQKDPMSILEKLKNLKVLQLRKDSYWGKELICSTGGFPSLERLELSNLPRLNKWEIKEAAMPLLSQLQISGCPELQELPELAKVLTQQVLIESDLSEELCKKMQSGDQIKFKRISTVRLE